jgi:hypothetical protein
VSKVFSAHAVSVDGYISGRDPSDGDGGFGRGLGDAPMLFNWYSVGFFRTDTAGLLNALDAARAWPVRRFAVASSIGFYIGGSEIRWHEELALPTAARSHSRCTPTTAVTAATHPTPGARSHC